MNVVRTDTASRTLDPVLLEIMDRKVCAIADEMCAALTRTSRSVFVNEGADFAIGLVDVTGEMFGWAPENKTTSVHPPCRHTLQTVGEVVPGDVIVTNDPYHSRGLATHLPDLHLLKPYFHGERLVAFGWAFVHFMDVGGAVPGSISRSLNDIFQEGLRIPPMKLMKAGQRNEDLVRIFQANCRLPDINMRDVDSMMGALQMGERRVRETIEQYGLEAFLAGQEALKAYSEEKVRAVLRRLPDGVYDFWEYLDDDGASDYPVRVRLRLTVDDDSLHFDVSGSDPQVPSSLNIPTMGTLHNMLTRRIATFVRTHDQSIPLNAGFFRPMGVTSPPGTVLNAEYPDAVGERFICATKFNDSVTGALLQASPSMMAGPTCGTGCAVVLTEFDEPGESSTVTVLQSLRGGMSAYDGSDGVDVRDVTMNTMHNHPCETMEEKSGVRLVAYDIRRDSGGPGRWRGGVGQAMTLEVLRDGSLIHPRGTDHMRFPPWGVAGGKPGATYRCVLNQGTAREKELGKAEPLKVNAGDRLTVLMPGAAGYGDPFQRDPAAVLDDVIDGFVSREAAAREYGVVIRDGTVDDAATAQLRTRRDREARNALFDLGPEREAWERVFDDDSICELNRRLYALPRSVRSARRRQVLEATLPRMPEAGVESLAEALEDSATFRARFRAAVDALPPAP